jgi:steroid 5-alpha reductase family enzyme
MLIWSIRLTYNWWKNWPGFKEQDWRYDLIEEKTKGYYFLSNFVAIHLIPTLVVYLQLINVYHILKLASSLNVFVVIGFMLMVLAAGLQFVADKQMFDFRQQRTDKSQCIDQGLWRYSRHPNYLGELTFWVGVYLIYLGAVQVIDFNIIYPLAMIALFLFISIPMMEKKLSDRPGYQTYKKKVSMLFPYRKVK